MRSVNWANMKPELYRADECRADESGDAVERIAIRLERIARALEGINASLTTSGSSLSVADVLESALTHTLKSGEIYGMAEVLGDIVTAIYEAGH